MFFRKKAILMIHGFVGGCYDFDNFHNELQTIKKFDIFTFTLPAHDKVVVKNVEFKEWLDESIRQIEFLINNGYKEIYLIGHSMGGVIATHLASIYPQVKKLVLAAPAFKYFYFKGDKVDIKSMNEFLKDVKDMFKDDDTEKTISSLLKTPISTTMEFTKLVKHCSSSVNYINCPTLTIHGTKDYIVPTEGAEYVHNNIKSKTNILINCKDLNHHCFTSKKGHIVKHEIKNFLLKKPTNKKEIINL